jgi:hypothetical protein
VRGTENSYACEHKVIAFEVTEDRVNEKILLDSDEMRGDDADGAVVYNVFV